jgi:hypothetical protein
MKYAQRVFTFAGIWGLIVLSPLYFSFERIGRLDPPPITHPDFFYGFVGVALTWQVAFLVIGRDPVRFRPMMVPAMVEKFLYVSTLTALWVLGRLGTGEFSVAVPDFVIGILFLVAYRRLRSAVDASGRVHDRPASPLASASRGVAERA